MIGAIILFAAVVPLVLLLVRFDIFHPHRRRHQSRRHRGQLARYIPGYYPLMREPLPKAAEPVRKPNVEPDDSTEKPRIHEGIDALESIKQGMFKELFLGVAYTPLFVVGGFGFMLFYWWVLSWVVPFIKAL